MKNTSIARRRVALRRRMRIMMRRMMTAWLPIIALTCGSVQAQTLTARLNKLLDDWKEKNAPGMAAMLVRNERIEYRRVFGFADLDARTPITPDTQFLPASLTKQFTAMAIMILTERHKLQFDDSLAKFCPEFPAYARTITIRNLLNHTAGLTQYDDILGVKLDANYFRSSKSPPAAHELTAAE